MHHLVDSLGSPVILGSVKLERSKTELIENTTYIYIYIYICRAYPRAQEKGMTFFPTA